MSDSDIQDIWSDPDNCDSGEKNSDNKRVNNMLCQKKKDFEEKIYHEIASGLCKVVPQSSKRLLDKK